MTPVNNILKSIANGRSIITDEVTEDNDKVNEKNITNIEMLDQLANDIFSNSDTDSSGSSDVDVEWPDLPPEVLDHMS